MAGTPRKASADTAESTSAAPLITETPEFRAAVETAVEAATAKIMAMLAGKTDTVAPDPAAADPTAGFKAFADALAMSIVNVGHQGVGKTKPVAPEIMAEREAAHGRMVKLIVDAFKASQVAAAAGDEEARLAATPLYKVRGVVYFGEQLVRPAYIGQGGRKIQQEIDWFRAPNDDLIPANDIAAAIHAEYRQWVGKKTMTPLDDLRDLAITAAGFAVKGGSSSLQRHGSMADIEAQQTGDHLNRQLGGLNVRGRADVKQVHILGTAHAPAIERA